VIRPFYSSSDIHKGTRWFQEIGPQLDTTNYGISCVTRNNVQAQSLAELVLLALRAGITSTPET